jgi:ClpP class serine protease
LNRVRRIIAAVSTRSIELRRTRQPALLGLITSPAGLAVNLGNLFWVVFLIFALMPLFETRWLRIKRAGQIAAIQKTRGSRVIAVIHRQESMRFFGFPLARYIDMDDAEKVLNAIRTTPAEQPIDMILHTPGGLAIAALQIARALRSHPGRVTVFIPHFAMSGGTLVALGADEIVMTEHAMLGPIDPQINGMPAASIIKVASEKPLSEIDDQTLIFADLGQKAIAQLKRQATELLRAPMAPDAAIALAEQLTSGRWTHDYPITVTEARALGLPVNTHMPQEVLDLMALFPQPVRTTQSVEFGPRPGTR